jgi:hypothetical protein
VEVLPEDTRDSSGALASVPVVGTWHCLCNSYRDLAAAGRLIDPIPPGNSVRSSTHRLGWGCFGEDAMLRCVALLAA